MGSTPKGRISDLGLHLRMGFYSDLDIMQSNIGLIYVDLETNCDLNGVSGCEFLFK